MQRPKDRRNQQKSAPQPAQRPGAVRNSVQLFGPRSPLRPNPHLQNAAQPRAKNPAAPLRNSKPVRPEIRASNPRPTPSATITNRPPRPAVPPPTAKIAQRSIQRSPSRVIQGLKLYPNLHPGAVEPVNPTNIFRLNSFAGQYRLHQVQSHGVNVPNQQYNFVRTREGDMLLHSRYRHPSIAEGRQVLYAGEVYFNNGTLEWWSNGSGHYQPGADDAEQAKLPMDRFFSYQQIIKGEHTRKKGKS